MNKLWKYILFFTLLSFKINAECKYPIYTFANLKFYISNEETVYPSIMLERKERIDRKNTFDILNNVGIDKYVDMALSGAAPSVFELAGQSYTILDLALANGAKYNTLEKIVRAEGELSKSGLLFLLNNYDDETILLLFKQTATNNLFVPYLGEKRSIANFLLIKSKFRLLERLSTEGHISLQINFYEYNLIDVGLLDFEQLHYLYKYVEVEEYNSKFLKNRRKRNEELDQKSKVIKSYPEYTLVELCNHNLDEIDAFSVAFAKNKNEVISALKDKSLNFESSIETISKKIKSPVIVEYVLKYKEDKKHQTSRNLTSPEKAFFLNFDFWKPNNSQYRLYNLARYISKNDSPELRISLSKAKGVKQDRYRGKNLSYLIYFYTDNEDLIKWSFNTFGLPNVEYGLSTLELSLIRSVYDDRYLRKINILNKYGIEFKINNTLISEYNEFKEILDFRKSFYGQ